MNDTTYKHKLHNTILTQIRKYLVAIGKPIKCMPNVDKINGLGDGMLRLICLRIEKLLPEGSKSLISMIHTKNLQETNVTVVNVFNQINLINTSNRY